MAKYDGRLKAMERHLPRAHFDMIPFFGPDDDGMIYDQQGKAYSEAEFMTLTGGAFINAHGDDDYIRDREIMDRLMAGDDTIKPYMLINP